MTDTADRRNHHMADPDCTCIFVIGDEPDCPVPHRYDTHTGGLDTDVDVVELDEGDG